MKGPLERRAERGKETPNALAVGRKGVWRHCWRETIGGFISMAEAAAEEEEEDGGFIVGRVGRRREFKVVMRCALAFGFVYKMWVNA